MIKIVAPNEAGFAWSGKEKNASLKNKNDSKVI